MSNDKTTVITGATAGIGKAMAFRLAEQSYPLILVGRNEKKLKTVKSEIHEQTGQEDLWYGVADFAKFKDIRSLSDWLNSEFDQLSLLINNAGLFTTSHQITEDGQEMVFQVNYLSHFLLTNLLFPLLKNADEARIVNVSSGMHKLGTLNFDDLKLQKKFNGVKAYGRSKLANIMFTYELDRKLGKSSISVNAVNPGPVGTKFASKHSNWFYSLFWGLYKYLIKSADQGAATPLYVATHPDLQHVSGQYFRNKKTKSTSKESYDEQKARKLWEVSTQITGLKEKNRIPVAS
jgi:NAD(P)-dependent dehydrogenase (short-subunit alcohol dehydrogenase family)